MTLNMKLKLSCAAALLAAVLCVPAWGASQEELDEKLARDFNERASVIFAKLWDMAKKTVAYNKHTSTTYDKNEKWWRRVWKKNGTEVGAASLKKNGKYVTEYIETTDPNLVFAGGIRVGASINVLEEYFKGLLNLDHTLYDEIGEYQTKLTPKGSGQIGYSGEDYASWIKYKDGKITAIGCWTFVGNAF